MAAESPDGIFKRLVESGLGIRFGRGVVGKTSHAMIVLILIWGLVVWKLGDSIVANSFLIGAALIATCIFIWWTRSTQQFAERNPAQAMLDGAEFLEYRRIETEAQGIPLPPLPPGSTLIEGGKR